MAESERLRKLRERRTKIEQEIRNENARIAGQERRKENRRIEIIGKICKEHAAINQTFREKLEQLLKEHVPEGERHLWPELFETADPPVSGTPIPEQLGP